MNEKNIDIYVDRYCELLRTCNGISDVSIILPTSNVIKVNLTLFDKLITVEFRLYIKDLIFIIGRYSLNITNKDINLIIPILVRLTILYYTYIQYSENLQFNYYRQLDDISKNYMDNLKYKIRNYKLTKLLK